MSKEFNPAAMQDQIHINRGVAEVHGHCAGAVYQYILFWSQHNKRNNLTECHIDNHWTVYHSYPQFERDLLYSVSTIRRAINLLIGDDLIGKIERKTEVGDCDSNAYYVVADVCSEWTQGSGHSEQGGSGHDEQANRSKVLEKERENTPPIVPPRDGEGFLPHEKPATESQQRYIERLLVEVPIPEAKYDDILVQMSTPLSTRTASTIIDYLTALADRPAPTSPKSRIYEKEPPKPPPDYEPGSDDDPYREIRQRVGREKHELYAPQMEVDEDKMQELERRRQVLKAQGEQLTEEARHHDKHPIS